MDLFNDLAGDAACKAALGILPFSRGQVRMIKIFNDQCMLMLSYHITDNCQVASLWTGWIWCFCTVYYGLINAVNDNGSPARSLEYYLYLSPCHHPFIKPLEASRLSSGAISHSTIIHLHPDGKHGKHSTAGGWRLPLTVGPGLCSPGFPCPPFPCTFSLHPTLLEVGGRFIIHRSHLGILNICWRHRLNILLNHKSAKLLLLSLSLFFFLFFF